MLDLDYDKLLPMALRVVYANRQERSIIREKLNAFGRESYHNEISRVKLGILYLASMEPEKIDAFIRLACVDYRDLLVAAEFPYSSSPWNLRSIDAEKYKAMQRKEDAEYLAWIEKIIAARI